MARINVNDKGYQVEGARELRRALKAAGADLADLKGVHRQVAQVVLIDARREAPSRKGTTRRSTRAAATTKGAFIRVGGVRLPWVLPLYYGWNRRKAKANNPRIRGGNIRANKWLLRALSRNREWVVMTYQHHIKNALKGLQ